MLVRYDPGLKAAGLSNMEASPEQENTLANYSQGKRNLESNQTHANIWEVVFPGASRDKKMRNEIKS